MDGFLLLAFLFLVAGVIAVPIASRLGLGSVLGYLLAGIAISPLLDLLHVDVVSIQHFAEFGVVMMLFLVGLELEPRMLWKMRNKLLGLWAAELMGKTGDDAANYAKEVVKADFEEAGHEDVVRKVSGDLGDMATKDEILAAAFRTAPQEGESVLDPISTKRPVATNSGTPSKPPPTPPTSWISFARAQITR